jgi:hypothetical protein
MQYDVFAKSKLTELANKIVLDEIHRQMASKKFSKKIIDATYIDSVVINDGEIEIEIVSDYEADDGFDVSKAREEGTKDHVLPKVLGRTYHWIIQGISFFSKGHKVKGIKAERIIEKTIKKKTPQLNREWQKAQDKFFEDTVNGS